EIASTLQGATVRDVLSKLFPLLDGAHTMDEITEMLSPVAGADILRRVIGKLFEARFVEDAEESLDSRFTPAEIHRYRHQLVFFDIATETGRPFEYQKKAKDGSVSIIGASRLAASIAAQSIKAGSGRIFGANIENAEWIGNINQHASFEGANISI